MVVMVTNASQSVIDMLNLYNLQVIEREERDESYVIHAQSVTPNRTCCECGSFNAVIIGLVVVLFFLEWCLFLFDGHLAVCHFNEQIAQTRIM